MSLWEGSIRCEECLGLTYISQLKFFTVVHIGNGDLTLRDVVVVIDVIGQKTLVCETKKQLLSKRPAHAQGVGKGDLTSLVSSESLLSMEKGRFL